METQLKNLKPWQKRYFLTQFTELAVFRGHDISWLFGKNLSRFNYVKLYEYYLELLEEYSWAEYAEDLKEEYYEETLGELQKKLNLI